MSATNDAQVEIATIHHTEGAEIIKKLLEAMKDQKKTSCDEKALTPEALGELQKHVFCEGNGVDDFDDGDLRDLLNRLINDNASITGKENDDLHSRIFKQFSNALRTTFEPCTNRDAFQDLNCEFNLALPWQWFLPDDRIENTSERGPPARNKAKQKKYGKLNDDQPLEKNDLSPYDICIVWSIKEDDEKIKKCKKCIKAAGLIVYTEEATVRKIYDKEAKDYTIMCVGIGDAPEQFKGNEHVPPLVYDYAKSEKQPSYRTERLLFEAHRTNYTLPLNSTIIEDCAHRGTPRKLVIKGDRITNSKGLRDFAGEYFEKGPDDQKKGLLTPLHTWETFLLQRHRGKREKEEHVCCELMLGRQVFNVFLIKLIVGNSLELWYSKVYSKAMNCTVFIFKLCGGCCFFKHNRKVEHKITKPNGNGKCASIARDFASQNTYSVKERAADYIEAVILFGYVSLFSISAPLMVPFALISVVLESQVDAYKLKRNYLRPMPRKAQDIGIIEDIFKLVAWISVFSNIYIATLVTRTKITDQLYDKYGATGKFLAFVIAEHLMIFIKSVISYLASATPLELEIQKERQNFVQNQIVESLLNANQVKFKVKAKRKKLEAEPEQNKAPANADESIPEEGKTRAKIRPKRSSSLRRRKSMVLL